MNFLKVRLAKGLLVMLCIFLFSCDKEKIIQKSVKNNISANITSVEKKRNLFNILISINNPNNDKYVMLYNYHSFEEKNYPKVVINQEKVVIDYNFFFKDLRDEADINDPAEARTDDSFTLLILPSGKSNVWVKNIPISDLKEKNYLCLYFSKMKLETITALPKDTKEYDIIANKKGFKNYKFIKKELYFNKL
ncbi:hypothetical protein M2347_004201 [Chryseobacterium sp. H1D6B]|uniref:hypothetical protein n=1 Tax=Chryseobacterium sp. H1D6B TaxID=2940588 RepID=UPI0015C89455|nr:hypothetical protein [Chryseobacterium sp. H1D6B]MDH6254474.1 hypothetical protein [Chryseobacterium sp. H1D6B]